MNKKIAEFAFRSFLHGNKIGYPPPNATFPPKKLPALWCIMKPNHPLKGPNCSATRWVLTPAAFLQPLRVNLEQVPLIVPAVLLCMGLGCGDPMVYDEDPTRWVGDDLKIFEDRYLSYILLFDIYMDLHFKTCFMIIMFIVFFSAYFPFRWFGGFPSNIFFDHDLESPNCSHSLSEKIDFPGKIRSKSPCLRASLNKARCNKRLVWPWCHICSDMCFQQFTHTLLRHEHPQPSLLHQTFFFLVCCGVLATWLEPWPTFNDQH